LAIGREADGRRRRQVGGYEVSAGWALEEVTVRGESERPHRLGALADHL
jgi:hypothetical protein